MASEYQRLKRKLDKVFSEYIRRSHADDNGLVQCVTCGCSKPWQEMQAGHFVSRTYNSARYEEDNVQPQCVSCNVYHSGRYKEYTLFMIACYGRERVDELLSMQHVTKKFTKADLEDKIKEYQGKIKDIGG